MDGNKAGKSTVPVNTVMITARDAVVPARNPSMIAIIMAGNAIWTISIGASTIRSHKGN